MAIGPLMLDLSSVSLTSQERELLVDPQLGGIILFTRNYSTKHQLDDLISEIRSLRQELIIAVDHEGVEYSASVRASLNCLQCAG